MAAEVDAPQLSCLYSQSHRTKAGLEACLGRVGACQMHVLLRARGKWELRGVGIQDCKSRVTCVTSSWSPCSQMAEDKEHIYSELNGYR